MSPKLPYFGGFWPMCHKQVGNSSSRPRYINSVSKKRLDIFQYSISIKETLLTGPHGGVYGSRGVPPPPPRHPGEKSRGDFFFDGYLFGLSYICWQPFKYAKKFACGAFWSSPPGKFSRTNFWKNPLENGPGGGGKPTPGQNPKCRAIFSRITQVYVDES